MSTKLFDIVPGDYINLEIPMEPLFREPKIRVLHMRDGKIVDLFEVSVANREFAFNRYGVKKNNIKKGIEFYNMSKDDINEYRRNREENIANGTWYN